LRNAGVRLRDFGLLDEFGSGLHAEPDQIKRIGESHGDSREDGKTAVVKKSDFFHGKREADLISIE
jgi:hypothetical protein